MAESDFRLASVFMRDFPARRPQLDRGPATANEQLRTVRLAQNHVALPTACRAITCAKLAAIDGVLDHLTTQPLQNPLMFVRRICTEVIRGSAMCRHYVAYYRVSTAKQGKSGLGLEAQEAAALAFIAGKGLDAKLLASFIEVESGKKSDKDRPELAKAMEHARLTGATLLIAKLDRLSRDAHFLLGLQKAGVQFIAADMPEANEMVVGLMAVIAQAERKMISQRTQAALAEVRKRVAINGQRGHPAVKRLGNPNGAAHLRKFGNQRATAALASSAQRRAAGLAPTFEALRAEGIASANAIAGALNARNYATPRGGKWTARSVLNMALKLDLIWLAAKRPAA